MSSDAFVEAQVAMLKLQLSIEDSFTAVAREYNRPAVIICDRGIMDCKAFVTPEQWAKMQEKMGVKLRRLRDECVAAQLGRARLASF